MNREWQARVSNIYASESVANKIMFFSGEPCQEQVKGHPSDLFFDFHANILHESLLGIRTITLRIARLFLLALCHQVGGMFLLAGSVGAFAFLETPTELSVGAILPLESNRATEKLFGCCSVAGSDPKLSQPEL